jgi:hypothetical protein
MVESFEVSARFACPNKHSCLEVGEGGGQSKLARNRKQSREDGKNKSK